jgi:hypothetical protein
VSAVSRHLSLAGFRQYVRSGVAIEHPIDGEPRLILAIDPNVPAVGLRAPRGPNEVPPRIGLEHLRVVATRGEDAFLELRVTEPRLFDDSYPVLCAVADRIQLRRLSFAAAVSDTLRLLGRLLHRDQGLSRERELGLCGELLLLLGLCPVVGAAVALAAWRGPDAEEHDFGLAGADIEVKTTASERRAHWIDSLTQLQPTADRPLWLVSHQLTQAGPDDGWRLGDLVAAARHTVDADGGRDDLDRRLVAAGWVDPLAEMVSTRWRRRFPSKAFLVGAGFPTLTADLLSKAGIGHARLTDVRYRIDLTDQPLTASVPDLIAVATMIEVTT